MQVPPEYLHQPAVQSIELFDGPARFAALRQRDLSQACCVVFDVLRATSSMAAALEAGATAILPVGEIAEAVAARVSDSSLLLAGERHGLRITSAQSGGTEFDFGNSPREFTPEKVGGRSLVMTTTNGTRALQACEGAREVLACSFSNLTATAQWISKNPAPNIFLVAAGTGEESALEDLLACGALADRLWEWWCAASDGVQMARLAWLQAAPNLTAAACAGTNARRLISKPALTPDFFWCMEMDRFSSVVRREGGWMVSRRP